MTHRFCIAGNKGYITVGKYPDGRPGEMFIVMAKEGSTMRALLDSISIATSIAWQHGVPMQDTVRKFKGMRFEPSGVTDNPEIRFADSIIDYVGKWLEKEFLQAPPSEDATPAMGEAGELGLAA